MVEPPPERSRSEPRRRDRAIVILEHISELGFVGYAVFAMAYPVPALENATFLFACSAAGACAFRQQQHLRLAAAVFSSIFAIFVLARGL